MTSLLSLLMAIVTYISAISAALPVFVSKVKDNPDFTWMVTASETREVSYEEYYAFYQQNYKHMRNLKENISATDLDIFEHPESYPQLPDNTELYQTLLDENLEIAKGWKETPVQGQVNFYNSVKDHGIWDYKRADRKLDWPTYRGKFLVYGVVMDWEIFGNINFAFTGCAVGFTPVVIRTGGGLVNIKNTGSKWEELPYYFDEEDDAEWIGFGVSLYALIDESYVDNARMIDALLTIADPRILGAAILIYRDLNESKINTVNSVY